MINNKIGIPAMLLEMPVCGIELGMYSDEVGKCTFKCGWLFGFSKEPFGEFIARSQLVS